MAFEPLGKTRFRERRDIKIQFGRQLIDGRADLLEVFRHPYVVKILRKTICRPLFLAVKFRKAKLADGMAVVFGILPINYGILAVNPYRPVIVRDGKGKELTVEFALAFHKTEELNDSPRRERHAVGVLAVYDVKRLEAALDLVR